MTKEEVEARGLKEPDKDSLECEDPVSDPEGEVVMEGVEVGSRGVRVGCAGVAVNCRERVGLGVRETGLEGVVEGVEVGDREGLRRGVRVLEREKMALGVGTVTEIVEI